MEDTWRMKAGKYMITVQARQEAGRIWFQFPYNLDLMNEIKMMAGAKYHGYDKVNPRKQWSVYDNTRNWFQINYLRFPGNVPENPYYRYDCPIPKDYSTERPLRQHQIELVTHGLHRRQGIWAAEMGTGKSLAAIEVMEASNSHNWIWVGPKAVLYAIKLELNKWNSFVRPKLFTYEKVASIDFIPDGVIFDEASRLKNPQAQRTQSAMWLTMKMRERLGNQAYIILMSGSPAPKAPTDWWSLAEIACPGFLREGDERKFKNTLALTEQRESLSGGVYPHLIGWRDSELKCKICGKFADDTSHDSVFSSKAHPFEKGTDEVGRLYRRLKGLVVVKFKKDCTDLPDLIYRVIQVKPTQSMLNAMHSIRAKSPTVIQALTLCRELSDGFQYKEVERGTETCELCRGSKIGTEFYDPDYEASPDEIAAGFRLEIGPEGEIIRGLQLNLVERPCACPHCDGTGEVASYSRTAATVDSPKDDALEALLEECEDVGRIIIYGGFTGTIDRLVKLVIEEGWSYIRVDGRGWISDVAMKPVEMLEMFQSKSERKIAFIGHPGSAGMGLNLQAAPMSVYYSNDFNGESRIQSEHRGHREGMNVSRGHTIVDIYNLPTDKLVHDNLKKKKRLQDLTLGQLDEALKDDSASRDSDFGSVVGNLL